MRARWLAAIIPGGIVMVVVVFVVVLLIVKLLWSWTIPDLFPGAVAQGLVTREISWLTALKVAIFVSVLGGIMRGHVHRRARE
jgi:hypothetical protein